MYVYIYSRCPWWIPPELAMPSLQGAIICTYLYIYPSVGVDTYMFEYVKYMCVCMYVCV